MNLFGSRFLLIRTPTWSRSPAPANARMGASSRARAAPLVTLPCLLVLAAACACNRDGDAEPEQEERLRGLGYVTETSIEDGERGKVGVVRHLAGEAYPGLNVYCSEDSATLRFVDMEGTLVHRVVLDVDVEEARYRDNLCKTVAFTSEGDFVMVIEETRLIQAALDGRVHWELPGAFHHDVDLGADGTVYAVRNGPKWVPQIESGQPIRDDTFVRISPDGVVLDEVSLAEMVVNDPALLRKARSIAPSAPRRDGWRGDVEDIFHTNTVEVLKRDVPNENGEGFAKGQVLFAARFLDVIGVASLEERRIVWHWGLENLEWPHHPSLLPDGNLLVFDNGVRRGFSEVLEIAPFTGEIRWRYRSPRPEDFFCYSRGSAQALPNGNVLITESPRGRVFEVDREGRIVWEFWNPDRDARRRTRATIFRMERLSPAQTPGWPVFERIVAP